MRATAAVVKPNPSQKAMSTTRPMAGAACPRLARDITGVVSHRSGFLVSRIPKGMAIMSTTTIETAVSSRCCTVRLSRFDSVRVANSVLVNCAVLNQIMRAMRMARMTMGCTVSPCHQFDFVVCMGLSSLVLRCGRRVRGI